MQFEAVRSMSRRDLRKHELVRMVSLRIIKVEEELFGDCGESFVSYKIGNTHFFQKSRMRNRRVKVRRRLGFKMP